MPKHGLLLGSSDEKIELLYGLDTSEDNVIPSKSGLRCSKRH